MSANQDRVRVVVDAAVGPDAALSRAAAAEAAMVIVTGLGLPLDPIGPLSERTLRYYQQRGIVDPADGRTTNARYRRRHVLQAVAGRLGGAAHAYTLDDVADALREASEGDLMACIAEFATVLAGETDRVSRRTEPEGPRPLPAPGSGVRITRPAALLGYPLPGGAHLLLPEGHPAARGGAAARSLARDVARALGG